jgi:oligopeptide/dipeptide ABC transporter ATP-binding protein
MSRQDAWRRAVELLDRVHIARAADRAKDYPHQFSGGMCQRVGIAIALACEPQLLVADEPTTALDVTVQHKILELIREVQRESNVGVLFITHDFGVVAEMCDSVTVMYAGQVVERAPVVELFDDPRHPYTAGLLQAVRPRTGAARLHAIKGQVPLPGAMPSGCRFHPRCEFVVEETCTSTENIERVSDAERWTQCVRAEDLVMRSA